MVPMLFVHRIEAVADVENIYNESVDAGPDGCCLLPERGGFPGLREKEGGKSELHRAVCRITSGMAGSSPLDGKCHREDTASLQRGKGEKVR
jgi:hypothetical protein